MKSIGDFNTTVTIKLLYLQIYSCTFSSYANQEKINNRDFSISIKHEKNNLVPNSAQHSTAHYHIKHTTVLILRVA